MVSEPVPFPSVTLCNMRSLDFAILNRINEMFKEDNTSLSFVNKSLGDPFIQAYMNLVARFSALYYSMSNASPSSDNEEIVRALHEGITRSALFSYIPKDVLARAGIQLEQYVAICVFAGSECNMTRDFSRLPHPYYFNCYIYTLLHHHPSSGCEFLW